MSEQLVTPNFLTSWMAESVVRGILDLLMSPESTIGHFLKRKMLHVVILVPGMKDERAEDYPSWPNYPIEPVMLYEYSVGKPDWPHPFDNIARCKALQLWHERNNGGTDVMPHLLFPGDTPYWGGVKRDGIVVACSGVQPWFDRMIAGMIADALIAMSYNAWMTNEYRAAGVDFIS